MQAIITKYIGASATKPSRIKASCSAGSITISYSYDLDVEGCHTQAANALVKKLGWDEPGYGRLICGGTDSGFVFVFETKAVQQMRDALGNLIQYAVGNRGHRSGNPYEKTEIKTALHALYFDTHGRPANNRDHVGAADSYAIES